MDGPNFHVDVSALDRAANGLVTSFEDHDRSDLADVPGDSAAYGNDDLHAAFADFCERWSYGLDVLTEDARVIGGSLRAVADAYRGADRASAARLTGDPGSAVVDG